MPNKSFNFESMLRLNIPPEHLPRVLAEVAKDNQERQTRDAWGNGKEWTSGYQPPKLEITKRRHNAQRLEKPPAPPTEPMAPVWLFGRTSLLITAIRDINPIGKETLPYEETLIRCLVAKNLMEQNPDWLEDKNVLHSLRAVYLGRKGRFIVELLYKDYFRLASKETLSAIAHNIIENQIIGQAQMAATNDQKAVICDILENRKDLAPEILAKLDVAHRDFPRNKAIVELLNASHCVLGIVPSREPQRGLFSSFYRAFKKLGKPSPGR